MLANIVVGALILAAVFFAVRKVMRSRGGCECCGTCDKCAKRASESKGK
ncbi:MAG: FeoB-associated Cys-rich membrane protein [Synergistaceae bacterium]|jgi:hypothetical protein|nr:FeoB-associated Cys-rich membrane protein [Synergistaceae bacterium]